MTSVAPAIGVLQRNRSVVSLHSSVTRGAFWTIFLSTLNKGIGFASQLILAYYLVPAHFGVAAMALSVTNIATFFSAGNLRHMLIQDTELFTRRIGQVFWFSLSLNAGAALLVIGLSPLAAGLFQEPAVIPLILIAALSPPLQSLNIIYAASVSRQLRFGRIALIHFVAGLAQNALSILLAVMGFGAYALVVPLAGTALVVAIGYRLAAGRIRIGWPAPAQWGNLYAPVSWLVASGYFSSVHLHGTNFITGIIEKDPVITGYYYWGFLASGQIILLLTTNMQAVLFPALSHLGSEPVRQFAAVRRFTQALAGAAVPICILQVVLAPSVITFLFPNRWDPAIPVVQWLSIGLVTQPLIMAASCVLLARGRYRDLAAMTGFVAFVYRLFHCRGRLARGTRGNRSGGWPWTIRSQPHKWRSNLSLNFTCGPVRFVANYPPAGCPWHSCRWFCMGVLQP